MTTVLESLNLQVTEELYAAYLYLSMSLYFEKENLKGFAAWMHKQALEEYSHAEKIMRHLIDRGHDLKLAAVAEPKHSWNSPLEVFKDALEHEKKVTKAFHGFLELALQSKDYASIPLIHWFVDEQVEEEAQTQEVVEKLLRVGSNVGGLMVLDSQMAARH